MSALSLALLACPVSADVLCAKGQSVVVVKGNKCSAALKALNLSRLGIAGVAGPQGEKGIKGDKGDTGPAGPQGATGAAGPQGSKGDTGETGSQGLRGLQGFQGAPGGIGPKGDKGDKGDDGLPGFFPVTDLTTGKAEFQTVHINDWSLDADGYASVPCGKVFVSRIYCHSLASNDPLDVTIKREAEEIATVPYDTGRIAYSALPTPIYIDLLAKGCPAGGNEFWHAENDDGNPFFHGECDLDIVIYK